MNFISLLLTLFVGLFILVGSALGLSSKNNKKLTDFSISMAFGVIISLILFEILPETFNTLSHEVGIIRSIIAIILLVLIGIFTLKILDLFVPYHEHETHHHHLHKSDKCHNEHLSHIGLISSITVIVHNVIEGMSLYLVATNNLISGMLLCIGIGLHNIPMGLVITTTLVNSNYKRNKIMKISSIVSISTFIGGFIMFVLGGVNEMVKGVLLGFTLGMLIYISIFELLHQIYHMKNKRVSIIGISIGVVLLFISVLLEHMTH